MKNTIKKIYRSDAFLIERCGIHNKKLKELEAKKDLMQSSLEKRAEGEVKSLMHEYEEILFEISNQYNEEYFAKGFELGVKIATEVFYK